MYFFFTSGNRHQLVLAILGLGTKPTRPLGAKTELRRLELQHAPNVSGYELRMHLNDTYHQVRVLSTRHLVVEDTRVGRADIRLETSVQHANLRPVHVQSLDVLIADTGPKARLLESTADSTHWWLRGEARHAWVGESDNCKVHRVQILLSMATSTTSAPAAAAASILAVEIPAVSCEWT